MKEKGIFRSSARSLRDIRTLTTCAMLGAVSIILGYFTIQIGDFLKITFTSVPVSVCAYLFGPVEAPVLGASMDIINYMMKPTGAFFPGFTLSAAVQGLIMGALLYRKPLSLKRTLVATLIVMLLVDMVMNTLWLTILYGQAFYVIFPARALKNIIMWPIQTAVLFAVLKGLERAGIFRLFGERA